jgi:hypothetical protein
MTKAIIPPAYAHVEGPLVFLAGPIQGAPDWQAEAIRLLMDESGITVASPRRPPVSAGDFPETEYAAQVDWEHHYLARAAQDGVTMFWLAKESVHLCGRAYAQTTRFELGEAVTLHRLAGAKVVVGIEAGFSNMRYLLRTIAKKAPGIPLCSTLADTCAAAAQLARAAK